MRGGGGGGPTNFASRATRGLFMLQILLSRLSVRGVDGVIGSQRRNVSFFELAGGNILVVLALMLLKKYRKKREREREKRD